MYYTTPYTGISRRASPYNLKNSAIFYMLLGLWMLGLNVRNSLAFSMVLYFSIVLTAKPKKIEHLVLFNLNLGPSLPFD